LGPTSVIVLVLVLLLAAGLITLAAFFPRLYVKLIAAPLCLVVSIFAGAIIVNDFFQYYTSWGAAFADLTGSGNSYAVQAAQADLRRGGGQVEQGRLLQVRLPGIRSGINREGLVYLPPQYYEAADRGVRFPVIELLHGTPGDPSVWVSELHIVRFVTNLIRHREMGPVVLVMPDGNGGLRSGGEECLNTSTVKDETYIGTDVPADIRSRFRVSDVPTQWGLLGFSSGGYCAANLMMRHRAGFGSAAIIEGYFNPRQGPAAALLGYSAAAERANNPLATALALPPGSGPLPPCWVAVGTGDASDYYAGMSFARAVARLEAVPVLVMKGAHHTALADRTAIPGALTWTWQQLASPAQRAQFPTMPPAPGSQSTLFARPLPTHSSKRHATVLAHSAGTGSNHPTH
jgi:Predicted esterase